ELDVLGFAMESELIPTPTERLRVRVENGQLVLALRDASWRTAYPPAAADLAPLVAALRERLPDRDNAAVIVERVHSLTPEAERTIVHAIDGAGYGMVTCRPDMSNCR